MPHEPVPVWLRQYVAHAPRAAAVVDGPAHTVRAANAAFRRLRAGANGGSDADVGWPATDACLAADADAVRAVLDRARRTGAAAHGVVPVAGGDRDDAWACTAWPVPSPPARPAALVVELVPADEAERAGAWQRAANERLLVSALREHELAENAEAARRVVEQRVAERTADLAAANAALAAEVAERAQLEASRDGLRRQLAGAEEAERRRLARDLHDQLGQHLTAFALGLAEARRRLGAAAPNGAAPIAAAHAAAASLVRLEELARLMTRDARNLALELRPPELDDLGLVSAVETYVREWGARAGVAVGVAVTGLHDRAVPAEVGSALYRVLQEALTNVAKHAGASQVSVIVEQPDSEVGLIVEDNGRGFDADAVDARMRRERRLGLAGMRERAALAGGTLAIESSPGRGTTVFARLPMVYPDAAPHAGTAGDP